VAAVRLDRPPANALARAMSEELQAVARELSADETIRAVVVWGGQRIFAAGADIKAMVAFGPAEVAPDVHALEQACRDLEVIPKPVIAAVNGFALGGGCEIALACDFRLAARRAKIGQTELTLGLLTGAGGIPRLVKLLGLAKAKLIVLMASRFTAEEAHLLGLITQDFENDVFPSAVREFAAKLAKSSPIAYKLAKYVLNRAADMPLEAGLEMEAMAFGHVTSTEDVFEGLQAFMEKREPKFKGE
jgi:enoyl-CoA hydratase/3-hydroxyacyl-CoA dehydrogenase